MSKSLSCAAMLLLGIGTSHACDLTITAPWIREAPATVSALAGYATLSNSGTKPLTVVSATSAAFAEVQMHESVTDNGMVSMRPLKTLTLAPGEQVSFAPTGKHFMLMNPKPGLRAGDSVIVKIKDASGCESTARFKVSKQAAGASDAMDHEHMDHSHMNHEGMGSAPTQRE